MVVILVVVILAVVILAVVILVAAMVVEKNNDYKPLEAGVNTECTRAYWQRVCDSSYFLIAVILFKCLISKNTNNSQCFLTQCFLTQCFLTQCFLTQCFLTQCFLT